jgi:hypothetical protein
VACRAAVYGALVGTHGGKSMDRNEVEITFEIVTEEIEAVADALNQEGAEASRSATMNRPRKSSRGQSLWTAPCRFISSKSLMPQKTCF